MLKIPTKMNNSVNMKTLMKSLAMYVVEMMTLEGFWSASFVSLPFATHTVILD